MARTARMTEGRVMIGPGTLYSLLESFQREGYIRETRVEGRRRSYQITERGRERLEEEVLRLRRQTEDYVRFGKGAEAGGPSTPKNGGANTPTLSAPPLRGYRLIWKTFSPGAVKPSWSRAMSSIRSILPLLSRSSWSCRLVS